jgi:hypothetical protein
MRIGPIHINRTRRNAAGLKVYPWQALTEDRVTPELRQVVAKIARSEAKNYFDLLREEAMANGSRGECVSSHCVENGHMYIYPKDTP